MLRLQLYKIRVIIPSQMRLFIEALAPRQYLEKAIQSCPSVEIRSNYFWHIGNIEKIGDEGLYFAFGRTTKSIIEMWDEESNEFQEVEFDSAPYTHVFLDLRNQVLAIAGKSRLAPTSEGIARNLEKVMNGSDVAIEQVIKYKVTLLSDPNDFIKHIGSAYSVSLFSMSFSRPNPIDIEELFHKPMEKLLKESDGGTGETTLKGKDLNRDVIQELARSAAAAGDTAKAKMRTSENERPVMRYMKKEGIAFSVEELEVAEDRKKILYRIQTAYKSVRENVVYDFEER